LEHHALKKAPTVKRQRRRYRALQRLLNRTHGQETLNAKELTEVVSLQRSLDSFPARFD
jgi:hypothetical protein